MKPVDEVDERSMIDDELYDVLSACLDSSGVKLDAELPLLCDVIESLAVVT